MLSRRDLLEGGLAGLFLLILNRASLATDTDDVFPQGVASGDPTQKGIILWTRINPALHTRLSRDLTLEVAEDMEFKRVLIKGRIEASRIRDEKDFTVRVNLEGRLAPGRVYYYRFMYAHVPSMVGRFKTLPEKAEDISLAFVTCQSYPDGYYTAYRHIAEEDILLVVHLGDFIYERIYGRPRVPGRDLSLPSGQEVVQSLEDYQYLYRTYLSDPDIKLARAMHSFVNAWDDHEFINDYYYDYSLEMWRGSYPFEGREQMLNLRLAAIRAWLEYVPSRARTDLSNTDTLKWIRVYRDFDLGGLAHLLITDERSYRDRQPCDKRYGAFGCSEQYRTSMLGNEQLRWFLSKLEEGNYPWKVWANEVQFSQGKTDGKFGSLDAWDGYAGERQRILNFLRDRGQRNLLILTGDRHASLVAELPDSYEKLKEVLGAEFMTPAISSVNSSETGRWIRDWPQYSSIEERERAEVSQNPWIKHLNMKNWGYSVLRITKERAQCTIYTVNKYRKDSEREVDVEFVYAYGRLEKEA
ncbi:MAG: alkaline phosphatase D family protein [Aquificaceae bacterium]